MVGYRALGLLILVASAPLAQAPVQAGSGSGSGASLYRCDLSGTVDEGTASYLEDCVARAEAAELPLLVQVDTPGGALDSTRKIVRAFLDAKVPIIAWVGPGGARAASAGLLVVMAAHHASMAPATHLGAATPVQLGGGPDSADGPMQRKVLNDTAAFARMIAEQRGRNADWAERAVTEAATATADGARRLNVVDSMHATPEALLASLEGVKVQTALGETVLHTAEARVELLEPSLTQRFIHTLANPALAYLLVLLGGLGLAVELSNPGMVLPGVIGTASLVLAMVAFSALPVAAGAVVLLVLAVGLMVAELFVASGLLGGGGAILAVLAGVLLIDRFDPEWFVEPSFRLPLRVLVPTAVLTALGALALARRVRASQRLPERAGASGLVGEVGRTLEPVGPDHPGEVFIHGERWRGEAEKEIPPGRKVVVRQVRGLILELREVS